MKVISGGQTGADLGGVIAGSKFGYETGGCMPKGFKNETGNNPLLAKLYGMYEHKSDKYPPRTYENCKMSDGTIRFATDFDSRGEICTFNAIKQYNKPYIDVDVNEPRAIEEIVEWIREKNIKVLNVAGNRESTSPGTCNFVIDFLMKVFEKVESS